MMMICSFNSSLQHVNSSTNSTSPLLLVATVQQWFSPHLLVVCMLGLWLLSVNILSWTTVDYTRVLGLQNGNNHLLCVKQCLMALLAWLVVCVVAFVLVSLKWATWAMAISIIIYPAVTIVLLLCVLRWNGFKGLVGTFAHLLSTEQPTFADNFLVDILTSLVKVFSDWVCMVFQWRIYILANQKSFTMTLYDDPTCGHHVIYVTIAMMLPFLFRLYQCLRLGQSKNALKYMGSTTIYILSILENTTGGRIKTAFHFSLILVYICSSGYSWYWDIFQDWKLLLRARTLNLRPNQHAAKWIFYLWLGISDFLLRGTWAYKYIFSTPHYSATVMGVAILEILRRWQWAYFRIELEDRELDQGPGV